VRRHLYVGPAEIAAAVADDPSGRRVRSAEALEAALEALSAEDGAMLTYVVDAEGTLRLADRHSEHVACAAGGPVLTAGEIAFEPEGRAWRVVHASNQSTGYCPEEASWPALAAALDALGVVHEGAFTHPVVFRRCPACGERNLVKDDDYRCALCEAALPSRWNFDASG